LRIAWGDPNSSSIRSKKKPHPEDIELLPEGGGWLLVEFGGSKEEADDAHRA
jgi:hypothetical protein